MTRLSVLSLLAACMFVLSGCSTPPVTPQNLTLVFDNQTDTEVDPNFYLADANVTVTDLFGSAANMYKNFNGKTTIPAKTSVTVTFDYAKAVTIGSNHASFGSITMWTGGKSEETPILHQGVDFDGPEKITFTFSQDSAKKYHTNVTVTPAVPAL